MLQFLKKKKPAISEQMDVWVYDNGLRKRYGLSCIEACFFGIIKETQCRKKGHCFLGNRYFMDKLGIKHSWINNALNKLSDLGLIWIHYYFTKKGTGRQIVVKKSVLLYQRFLKSHQSYSVLQKFNHDFGDKNCANISALKKISDDEERRRRSIFCKVT